jgi:hypothetical protein
MNASLRIGRIHTACHVAGWRSAPAVRDRASRACRDHLPIALQHAVRAFDVSDDSLWIVRRIDLSIITRIEAAPGDIALSITRSLGRALAKVLTGDGDGVNAIRFRNRAAYLSRFITDVAAGAAWTRWYFAPLSGWRLLPASAAIRSALVEDPVTGLGALRALDISEWQQVVGCLTVADEQVVLTALSGVPHDAPKVAASPTSLQSRPGRSSVASRPLARFLRSAGSGPREPHPPAAEYTAVTRFGGLALLLRDVNALPWARWTAGWPAVGDVSPDTCMKWITLATCSGRARVELVLADNVWRDLMGIPQTLSLRDVAAWLRALETELEERDNVPRSDRRWLAIPRAVGISRQWEALFGSFARLTYAGFARRLPGFASSSIDYVWRHFLDIDASVEWEPDQVVLRCGRAPLHMVLVLTGMTRALVAGSDPRGCPMIVCSRE